MVPCSPAHALTGAGHTRGDLVRILRMHLVPTALDPVISMHTGA